jgi:hypothetical protein
VELLNSGPPWNSRAGKPLAETGLEGQIRYRPQHADVRIALFAGGIMLPTPGADAGGALIDDFEVKGKLRMLFVAAYLMLWVPLNAWGNGGWLNVAVFINPAMTVPLLVAYYARPGRLRDVAATLFFVAQAFALLFVYSSPTDVS